MTVEKGCRFRIEPWSIVTNITLLMRSELGELLYSLPRLRQHLQHIEPHLAIIVSHYAPPVECSPTEPTVLLSGLHCPTMT